MKVINVISKEIPTYYCRYEDLYRDPVPVLNEIFCFLLDTPSIEGTVVAKRIQDIAAEGFEAKAVYKLKSRDGNLNRNAFMYSEEQMDLLKKELKETLCFFGYTKHPTQVNDTAFFDFEDVSEEDLAVFKAFKTENQKVLSAIGQVQHDKPNYRFNAHGFIPFDKSGIKICSTELTFDSD